MKRIVALAAAALVATLLVMVPAAPVSADTGLCAGVGGATVGGPGNGLYYPVLGPKRTRPFTFGPGPAGSVTCVTDEGSKVLTATGTVNGYCGLSYGRGFAFGNVAHDFQFIGIGGELIIEGQITGSAVAVPDPTIMGNSCLPTMGGAWNFIVGGAVVKNHVVQVIKPLEKFPPELPAVCPNAPTCP